MKVIPRFRLSVIVNIVVNVISAAAAAAAHL